MALDLEAKIQLVKRPPTEEILVEDELRKLLEEKKHPEHYIGIEISGKLHLGMLFLNGFKINDFLKAGFNCKILLADWHSYMNNKLGGDWERIKKASEYYRKAFEFFCPGVKILLGSELYHHNDEYWKDLIRFCKKITLARNVRCLTIMGRSEKDKLDFSQYLYPPMQATDVKYLGKDIAHGGMDQRKVHVLCREVFPKLGWPKPIAVHHHLLRCLSEPPRAESKEERVIAAKMSKSKPWTCIFIHDSKEEIRQKLIKAWCPPREAEFNPVLEILKYVIFHEREEFELRREKKYGGPKRFSSYEEVERAYRKGEIHPQDLKLSVAEVLDEIVAPIRKFFEKSPNSKLLEVFEVK